MRQASAACESDPKKGKGLANKVMKMKEDITREVLNRATAMADREERAVLMTVVNALNKSDTTRALKVRLPFPVHSALYALLPSKNHPVCMAGDWRVHSGQETHALGHMCCVTSICPLQVLEERLMQLSRRGQQRQNDSSDDSYTEEEGDSDDALRPRKVTPTMSSTSSREPPSMSSNQIFGIVAEPA